ncbi:glycosyltransferase [Plantactinospora sp. BC1]|uniref:glycosyltransferase n=1 Tax=Plantactinospora sp. BC1 TaxID=2108470 RepID=UPI0018FE1E92|nr:glycosyltransferase [Plantactinospora sp. BC1]
MRWLVFGSYDVRRHPRVGVLVEGLRAAGDEVTELNEPLTMDTAARIAVLRQPWRLPLLVSKLARCWALLVLRALRQRHGSPPGGPVDAVLVGYLGHFDVHLARPLFRGTPIVLDHLVSAAGTARDRGLADARGARLRLMRAIDDAALHRADVVLVDTEEHLDALPAAARDRGTVVPVGAGAAWFAAGARTARERWPGDPAGGGRWRLRVVFVGLFTPLHGTRTLGAALAALAGDDSIEVTVVGTGQEHPGCRRAAADNPRVIWHDWIPAAELPDFVAGHHVSLGIFGATAKAGRVVPTKVYQGAAAGCAIVTSDTAPQRRALGDAAVFVPAGDPSALADALRDLAGDPDRLARLRRAARRRALEHFWPATVVAPVRHRIDPAVGRDAGPAEPSPDAAGAPSPAEPSPDAAGTSSPAESSPDAAGTPSRGNLTAGPVWWLG